jgi:hypothetical protein
MPNIARRVGLGHPLPYALPLAGGLKRVGLTAELYGKNPSGRS